MGEQTEISWATHTFNPWWGCERVSPACQHCYAETLAHRFGVEWGKKAERRFFGDKHWNDPVRWDRAAAKAGERHRVFCASMADVFEDRPELVEHRARLWDLIEATANLDWLLLTKRPENVLAMVPLNWMMSFIGDTQARIVTWPFNAWVGTTVEDQQHADERIPHLLDVPAPVRFLSCEPLLGPVDLGEYLPVGALGGVGWVIAGGESGPGARPMHLDWVRSLRDDCTAAGVPFHFKQWGEHDSIGVRVGRKAAGRQLDGRTWDEMPDG